MWRFVETCTVDFLKYSDGRYVSGTHQPRRKWVQRMRYAKWPPWTSAWKTLWLTILRKSDLARKLWISPVPSDGNRMMLFTWQSLHPHPYFVEGLLFLRLFFLLSCLLFSSPLKTPNLFPPPGSPFFASVISGILKTPFAWNAGDGLVT